MHGGLAGILDPFSVHEFQAEYLHRRFLHVPGPSEKFGHLMPWSVLNDILRHHAFDPPRIRLIKDGQAIPPEAFLRYERSSGGLATPTLAAAELTKQLRLGATLLLNMVDRVFEPVTCLAQGLEREFSVPVTVNLYAGWRTSKGFDLHWDDHDVLILQVAGRKKWALYGQTVKDPVNYQSSDPKPNGEALWTDVLCAGDLLYIPRGCWHVATPLDEPTLHLTVGIPARTGMQVLQWLLGQLSQEECVRADVPISANSADQDQYMSALQEAILRVCTKPGLLKAFERDWNVRAEARPALGLPWSATSDILPPTDACVLSCLAPRTLEVRHRKEAATIEFGFQGKLITLHEDALPLIEFLSNSSPMPLGSFYGTFEPVFEREQLVVFLSDMVTQGIICLQETETELGL